MRPIIGILLAPALLSACSSGLFSQDNTNSGFASPASNGVIDAGLDIAEALRVVDADGEGFAYQAGVRDRKTFTAVSGLLPGTNTESWPVTGTATYNGSYSLLEITNFDPVGSLTFGDTLRGSGTLNLNANFAQNTVTGTSNNGLLQVNGTVNGGEMGGSVIYDGVRGTLDGQAGSDQIFGVFHGNNNDLVYAGGFIADRN